MANTVTIQITSVNRSGPGIAAAITQIQQLTVTVHQAGRETDRTSDSLARLRSVVSTVATKVIESARSVGTMASALFAGAKGAFLFGKALGGALANLTPLIAFLPSLAAGVGLVITTLKLAGPGLAKAFEPITRQFHDAKGETTALTKELQRVIGIDVQPAAMRFVEKNMFNISEAMKRIAYQTNLIIAGTLRWASSANGVAAIKTIVSGTADVVTKLQPKLILMAEAFGNLAGRAGDPALKGLGNLLGKIVDKLTEWANGTSTEDIKKALSDLSGYGGRIREIFGVLRDVGRWMGENQALVKAFSDTVAASTIAIGIATGNIPAILAGTSVLLVNHWKDIKDQLGGFASDIAEIFDGSTMPTEIMDSLRAIGEQIGPTVADAMERITNAVRNNKEELEFLGRVLADYVIPILGYVFLDTLVFVGKAIENCINVVGALTAAFQYFSEQTKTNLINMALIVINQFDTIVGAAAKAFGWVPEIGPKLQQAANEVHAFVEKVNNDLKNIRDEDVYIRTHFVGGQGMSRGGEYRTGGIIGGMSAAMTGGVRQGLVEVGEEGRELVRLPTGSSVFSKPTSTQLEAQASKQSGGMTRTVVEFAGDLDSGLAQWFMNAQRTGQVQIYQTAIA